jgi:hypothetical protein
MNILKVDGVRLYCGYMVLISLCNCHLGSTVGSLAVYVLPTRVEDMAEHVAEPPVPRALSSL